MGQIHPAEPDRPSARRAGRDRRTTGPAPDRAGPAGVTSATAGRSRRQPVRPRPTSSATATKVVTSAAASAIRMPGAASAPGADILPRWIREYPATRRTGGRGAHDEQAPRPRRAHSRSPPTPARPAGPNRPTRQPQQPARVPPTSGRPPAPSSARRPCSARCRPRRRPARPAAAAGQHERRRRRRGRRRCGLPARKATRPAAGGRADPSRAVHVPPPLSGWATARRP